MHFALPSTAAQYFHLLRRQMTRPYRKPLVVFSPKSMLRLPATTASLDDLMPGTTWHSVLDDPSAVDQAQRVVFLTGQLYYKLVDERTKRGVDGKVAFVRLEVRSCLLFARSFSSCTAQELSPFPYGALETALSRYRSAKTFMWAQEEPENAGAYTFVANRLAQLLEGRALGYIGRRAMAAPASGIALQARSQQSELIEGVFAGL